MAERPTRTPNGAADPAGSRLRLEFLGALVDSGMTFPGLARLLAGWTLDCLPNCTCEIRLKHPAGPWIRFAASCCDGEIAIHEGEEPPLPSTSSGTQPPILTPPNASVELLQSEMDSAEIDIQGYTSLPISHGADVYGHLAIRSADGIVRDDVDILARLVAQFGFLLHHRISLEQASDMAFRDDLTGLYNRRYLRQAMEQWLPRARRERFPVSLFLLDVDHFKLFNDTWGHATGDRVLCVISNLLRSVFRTMDVVCRYGGEEFAVLLCDNRRTDDNNEHPREVFQFAERFRRAAEVLSLTSDEGRKLSQITISGGIASFPWDASSSDQLLRRADEALYRAKRNGRNRIYFAGRDEASKAG